MDNKSCLELSIITDAFNSDTLESFSNQFIEPLSLSLSFCLRKKLIMSFLLQDTDLKRIILSFNRKNLSKLLTCPYTCWIHHEHVSSRTSEGMLRRLHTCNLPSITSHLNKWKGVAYSSRMHLSLSVVFFYKKKKMIFQRNKCRVTPV